ncbi:DNA cytosine methyltransferase [Streptosporangium amethystogenes subsp. fukuiense]|uniref:DNA cytosine methyltransferase n=1 Tax=Streptosporangium amethystogenes subsp. fukuiense TaxID=698418 RepID=A0ABW2TEZ6_9ACTN
MSREPMIIDAFCGAGGAAMGYHRAGWRVVGVDLAPQPDYPFDFHQGDAVAFIRENGYRFDAIHASPPCQRHCALTAGTNQDRADRYPDLIAPTRDAIEQTGRPYVMEQPQGRAPIRRDITLCGEMYKIGVLRHRHFELGGWATTRPVHRPHRGRVRGWRHGQYHDGPYLAVYGEGGGKGSVAEWQEAMGIDWTADRKAIAEAIPPAYTQWIGERFIRAVRGHGADTLF